MRYALNLPNFGDFADIRSILAVAEAAEASGWDGLFLWDHIAPEFPPGTVQPTADVTVALAAIATTTQQIRFGALITPLARRRPQKVARELVSLDRLSEGRAVLGVGLGYPPDTEFAAFGEETDDRRRGERLDESLDAIVRLWGEGRVDLDGHHLHLHTSAFLPRPVQQPRIPVWVAATWPGHARPLRRAARWDGVVPISVDLSGETFLQPDDIRELREQVGRDRNFDVAVTAPPEGDPQAYEAAGATWWLQVGFGHDHALAVAAAGPPRR